MSCKTINDILENDLCIGCGICSNFSKQSKMKLNEKGFLNVSGYVHDNNEISEVELVETLCPGRKSYANDNNGDPVWGVIKSIKLGHSSDPKVRFKGSSGGTITQTLLFLLENNMVDYVIHIEDDPKDPLANKVVITNDKDKVLFNTGSRYCPSSPLNNVIGALDKNKRYAFVGRPCDIVALSNYERVDKDISNIILFKISFFCAGAPGIKGTHEILAKFGIQLDDVKSFRYRGNGWPGYTTVITKNNESFKMLYDDSWGKILNKHLPKRCKFCPDGIGMESDIVFGDGWDCDEKGYPIFTEGDGNSIIIARTLRGEKILDELIKKNKLVIKDFDIKNLRFVQPYQYERRTNLKWRLNAMKMFNKTTPVYEKSLMAASKGISSKSKIKAFAGTLKRIINKRI